MIKPRSGRDNVEIVCNHVRRAALALAANPERYVPDAVFMEGAGEIVLRIPLGGPATVETDLESYLIEDQPAG